MRLSFLFRCGSAIVMAEVKPGPKEEETGVGVINTQLPEY